MSFEKCHCPHSIRQPAQINTSRTFRSLPMAFPLAFILTSPCPCLRDLHAVLLVAVGQRHGTLCLGQQVSAPPDVSHLRAAFFLAHKFPAFSTPLALSPFADIWASFIFLAVIVHQVAPNRRLLRWRILTFADRCSCSHLSADFAAISAVALPHFCYISKIPPQRTPLAASTSHLISREATNDRMIRQRIEAGVPSSTC